MDFYLNHCHLINHTLNKNILVYYIYFLISIKKCQNDIYNERGVIKMDNQTQETQQPA